MELRLPHMLHLFNVFRENKDSDNCAQLLEEECNKMFDIQSLNDEHDCNVVSMMLMICKATSLGMLCLMKMIFLVPQVLMRIFIMMKACLLFMMIILMKVGLEECQLYVMMIPLFWRVLNLIVIIMKVDLERSQLYLMMIPLFWKRFQLIMTTKLLYMII